MTTPKESTYTKILQAALEIFVEKGFAGASISMIAKKAGINQSLIYHHFENKLELWKHVKANFVERHYPTETLNIDTIDTLEQFITSLVKARFEFYFQNPEVIRMMNWQRLDAHQTELAGNTPAASSSANLKDIIIKLQKLGHIRQDLDPDMTNKLLGSAITAPLYDSYDQFTKDPIYKEKYIQNLIDFLTAALRDSKNEERNKTLLIFN